jgi:hypothetical protein
VGSKFLLAWVNDNAHLAPPSVADGKQAQGWLIEGRRRAAAASLSCRILIAFMPAPEN